MKLWNFWIRTYSLSIPYSFWIRAYSLRIQSIVRIHGEYARIHFNAQCLTNIPCVWMPCSLSSNIFSMGSRCCSHISTVPTNVFNWITIFFDLMMRHKTTLLRRLHFVFTDSPYLLILDNYLFLGGQSLRIKQIPLCCKNRCMHPPPRSSTPLYV